MYLSHARANKIAMTNEMFIVGDNDDKEHQTIRSDYACVAFTQENLPINLLEQLSEGPLNKIMQCNIPETIPNSLFWLIL